MTLMLTGPAWSGSREEPGKQQVDPKSEVDMIEVDPGTLAALGQTSTLVPSGAFIDEIEPNDTTAAAQALGTTPVRVRANLFRQPFVAGNIDVDIFSFTAPAGARVYAATMTSWSSGSQDSGLDILDVDGTTVLEADENDGSFGGTASNVGGTLLATGGTYYVRVRQISVTSMSGRIAPYDLYVRVVSGTPTPEVEPNDATPNPLPANGWVSGTIDPVGDLDFFSLTANAGDTIVVVQDLDPERDAPDWNGRVGIGAFNNFILVSGDAGTGDTSPSEAMFMTVKATGTYLIYVDAQVAGVGGPAATYQLAVFVIPAKNRTCTTFTGTTGPITDLGTTDFTVSVPTAGTVGFVRANVTATHPATADLDVTLIGPDGNEVILFDDPATTAGAGAPQINVSLSDENGVPMSLFGVHSGMGYIPEVGGRMEFFKGMQQQGTWTLRVRDDTTANTGTLDAWSLEVCQPAPRPACLVPGPAETTILSTDFEAGDAGFTHSGTLDEWERGLPSFNPILSAHSGVNAWKTDLDNLYENSSNQDLLSPPIDLTSATGRITLNWWQKYNIESASFDLYWVEVRQVGNPASASRVFEWKGSTMNRTVGSPAVTIQQAAGWGAVQADISSFAGQSVEVRFHLQTDSSVQLTGVGIDDVLLTACTTVEPTGDLSISKTDGQATYFPGQVLTYTIVASNAGPADVTGATVADNFTAQIASVSWTCSASAGSSCGTAGGTGDINATVNLLAGGTATFTATATVSLSATGTLTNTATISAPAGVFDPNLTNNSATDVDTFTALSNLGITKTDGQTTYFPGEVLTYTIVASNAGPNAVVGATVTDNFPADLTGVSWTCTASAGSACGSAGGTNDINATVNLLVGGTATFTATTTVSMAATGPIANTATIGVPAGTTDPDTANNSATDTDTFVPQTAAAEALAVDTANNGVYEPNETVVVAPTWRNTGPGALALTGALTNHTGPAGATYTIPDGAASYGTIAVGGTGTCATGGDCYSVANTLTTRPSLHWDSTAVETVTPTGATKTWTLHIGNSFTDVPTSNGFYKFVETILHNRITGGCGATTYCPSASTTREQMAVFVLVAKEGPGYNPPACTTAVFNDVPATSPFCKFIEELFRRGVVTGCGGGNYCPASIASRDQMAVFVLRTLDPTLNPPDCVPPNLFLDVPETSPFCKWIEELANRAVVTGCGGGNYCPTAPVTREQMSVFLTVTFGLVLYGL
jgi:uncharacterized repeat protein (TIGR01451 family)